MPAGRLASPPAGSQALTHLNYDQQGTAEFSSMLRRGEERKCFTLIKVSNIPNILAQSRSR